MNRFSLTLFTTNLETIRKATDAGIDEFIVDWECIGKKQRQALRDTEINHDTLDDLRRVRSATDGRVLCRINSRIRTTEAEVASAIDGGADEILVPMVRCRSTIEDVLNYAQGQCRVGILLETREAVRDCHAWSDLPISRVYVGLNDLTIECGYRNIFAPLVDGTVERMLDHFRTLRGFGGLTLYDRGFPVPCRLLIAEMARLKCQFSFLRRSFKKDIQENDWRLQVSRLRRAIDEAFSRTPQQVMDDRRDLIQAIQSLSQEP